MNFKQNSRKINAERKGKRERVWERESVGEREKRIKEKMRERNSDRCVKASKRWAIKCIQ